MNKKKLILLAGLFFAAWVVLFAANYFYLKMTVKPAENEEGLGEQQPSAPTLDLTSDISKSMPLQGPPGTPGTPDTLNEQKSWLEVVDSVVTRETTPIKEEVVQTREELKNAREQVDVLEDLLKTISASADSVDLVRAKRLSQMLEGMKPAEAAKIMFRLNSSINAELLLNMRQKNAAKILSAMPPNRAEEIARFLSKAYARSSI